MNTEKKIFWGVLITIVFIVLFPFLYYQEDICMRFNDNMDSNILWAKMLLDNNVCWSAPDIMIEQIMNGVRRSSLSSTYDLSLFIIWLFGVFWGYALNKVLMAVLAFVGMYFLLKKYFITESNISLIPILTGFLFSLLPFWSFTGSVALLPLVLWAFLNLRNGETRLVNWAVLLLYGFYASLVLTGFFILFSMSILFLYDIIKKRKINTVFFFGLAFLSIVFVISHWPIFYTHIFSEGYVSHRVEFYKKPIETVNLFWDFLLIFIHSDRYGASHVLALQNPFILFTVGSVLLLMIINKNVDKKFVLLLLLIIILSSIFGLHKVDWVFEIELFIQKNILPINLLRFYWLTPMLWYIIFGIALAYIYKKVVLGKYIVLIIFICQLTVAIRSLEVVRYNNPSTRFSTFYSKNQFDQIKSFINDAPKNYRVMSIGMQPSIAQFNGLYTLDAYLPDYQLEYKHKFGEVIEDELKKDPAMFSYFYDWGSRCYAFTLDTFRSLMASAYFDQRTAPIAVSYNFEKLKQLAQDKQVYIISTAEITNSELELVESFIRDEWYWKIRLYKVK